MAEHTPGPWHVGSGEGEGSIFADEGRMKLEEGKTTLYPIAIINPGWEADWEAEQANARLIAAAPAMCAALERIKAETAGAAESSTPSRMLVETLHYIAANVVDQAREVPAHA